MSTSVEGPFPFQASMLGNATKPLHPGDYTLAPERSMNTGGGPRTSGVVNCTTPSVLSSGQAAAETMAARDCHIESGKSQVEGFMMDKSLDEAADSVSAAQMIRRRKKPDNVKSACLQCRKRKAKCSDERPACRSCKHRDLECRWQTPKGLTRSEGLKREL